MYIIVTLKQVADPDISPNLFKIDPSGKKVVPPQGVAPIMNGYDANALEAALKLKEAHGGTVTVISFGPAAARDTLKRAIAMGADSAVLVDDPVVENADSWASASALARAIQKIGNYDLIMSGRQASDTDAGQTPFGIAELLGLPAVGPIGKIDVTGDKQVRVQRLNEDGYQVVDVQLPAVLVVSSEIGEPRYPPLRGIMAAGRAQIPVWSSADLPVIASAGGQQIQPKLTLRRLYQEARETTCEIVQGETPQDVGRALADKLREAKLI